MKIRNGFISNSSSSSFIINISKIDDMKLFENEIKKYDIDIKNYEDNVICCENIILTKEKFEDPLRYRFWEDFGWGGYSFDENILTKIFEVDKDAKIVIHAETGPEDDDFFIDQHGDLDYDIIELSDFSKLSQDLYNDKFKSLSLISKDYGAGRDG